MTEINKNPGLKDLFHMAFPMIISQGTETIMMFFDRLFLSKLGKNFISASLSGGLSSFVFASLFIGIVGYANAISAQYYGAKEYGKCSLTINQGFYLSCGFYPIILLIVPFVKLLFIKIGHTGQQVELEFLYFRILMFGSILILLRSVLVGFFLGIGRTGVVMFANIAGMCINIPLNYILIFGKFGFPKLGIMGAALGTLGGSLSIVIILACVYFGNYYNTRYSTRKFRKFDKEVMKKLLRFGMPAGAELFMNVLAFNIFILLMHSYSEFVAAAVSITFNWDIVAFIPMLGLGIATTALVGQQMGAKNHKGAEKIAYLSMKVSYVYAFTMMTLFIVLAPVLVKIFSGGMNNVDLKNIMPMAETMLRLASLYTLADATQLVFAGALRGAGDTNWVMRFSVTLHWIMAITAVILIKVIKADPVSVWGMFIVFIVILGSTMFVRFRLGAWKKIQMI